MALYEPIKVQEVDEEHGMADSVVMIKSNVEDVEMAVRISKLMTSSPPNDAVSVATAYGHPEGVTTLPKVRLQQPQQQRLVSLDVFRGLTVVVMTFLPLSLYLSSPYVSHRRDPSRFYFR